MPCDPDPLTALGQAALDQGSALARSGDGRTVALAPAPVRSPFDLKGMRAGLFAEAVAFPLSWEGRHPVSAIAAPRCGEMLVVTRQAGILGGLDNPRVLVVVDHNALVVDLAQRIMGLPTGPAPAAISDLQDALWLDRMVEACLAAPLGEAPALAQLLALHPAVTHDWAARQSPLTAEVLRHLRSRSGSCWSRLHVLACDHGVAWAGVGPALASWFDPGSLARWLFGLLAEPDVMLDELGELICADAHRSVCEVLRCSLSS